MRHALIANPRVFKGSATALQPRGQVSLWGTRTERNARGIHTLKVMGSDILTEGGREGGTLLLKMKGDAKWHSVDFDAVADNI